MSLDPHGMLKEVHPDLVRVLVATPQSPQPFQVIYGIRTLAAEEEAVATHHSETLHSRHLADPRYGGVAMAVDVWPIIDGVVSPAAGHEAQVFGAIAAQIIGTAVRLFGSDHVQWGEPPSAPGPTA